MKGLNSDSDKTQSDKKFLKKNLKKEDEKDPMSPNKANKSVFIVPLSSREFREQKKLKKTRKKNKNLLNEKRNKKCVVPLSANHMSSLGLLKHVFFDKTDTLTHSSLPPILTHISTPQKFFNLNMQTLESTYRNVKIDPSKYQKHDDLEELMKEKEDENYSEKSQEFFKEVKGEYDPGIFDEFEEGEIEENSFLESMLDS